MSTVTLRLLSSQLYLIAPLLALLLLPCCSRYAPERLAFVIRGDSILLQCQGADTRLWDRFTWEDEQGRFLAVGSSYLIGAAGLANAGLYVCRKQRFGIQGRKQASATESVRLVVLPDSSAPRLRPLVPPDMLRPAVPPDMRPSTQAPARSTPSSATTTRPEAPTTEAKRSSSRPPSPSPRPTRRPQPTTLRQRVTQKASPRPTTAAAAVRRSTPPSTVTCEEPRVPCRAEWNGVAPRRSCVSRTWVCDGEDDCGNGWDEANCNPAGPCEAITHACRNSNRTVPIAFRCDGDQDCPDGDDEWSCIRPHYITPIMSYVNIPVGSNERIRLNCLVRGLPKPTIRWGDAEGKLPGEHYLQETCSTEADSEIFLINSTLFLPPARDLHEKVFYCRASDAASGPEPSAYQIYMRVRV